MLSRFEFKLVLWSEDAHSALWLISSIERSHKICVLPSESPLAAVTNPKQRILVWMTAVWPLRTSNDPVLALYPPTSNTCSGLVRTEYGSPYSAYLHWNCAPSKNLRKDQVEVTTLPSTTATTREKGTTSKWPTRMP